jgi:hypothetical protein
MAKTEDKKWYMVAGKDGKEHDVRTLEERKFAILGIRLPNKFRGKKLRRSMTRRGANPHAIGANPAGRKGRGKNYYKNQALRRANPNIRKIKDGKIDAVWNAPIAEAA